MSGWTKKQRNKEKAQPGQGVEIRWRRSRKRREMGRKREIKRTIIALRWEREGEGSWKKKVERWEMEKKEEKEGMG